MGMFARGNYIVKVVHNNCPSGIFLIAITTLISIVSQTLSPLWRGLIKIFHVSFGRDRINNGASSFEKHKHEY